VLLSIVLNPSNTVKIQFFIGLSVLFSLEIRLLVFIGDGLEQVNQVKRK
jgi:hypothetical protein